MNKFSITEDFGRKKVLLIGDTILDIYSHCEVIGPCLDAPSVYEVEETKVEKSFGGAGLVTANILELGGRASLVSVLGDDEARREYEKFNHRNLTKVFFTDPTRRTTVKKSVWSPDQKLLQSNQVDNHYIDDDLAEKILIILNDIMDQHDVVSVLDAQHGLFSQKLIDGIVSLSKRHNKPLYVDSQISHRQSNHHMYRGSDTVLLSAKEAKTIHPEFDAAQADAACRQLQQKLGIKNIVVKLGAQGSVSLFNGEIYRTPAPLVEAMDTNGAGDAFAAAFSLGDRQHINDSLVIANTWAAYSTMVVGTKPPRKSDLINLFKELEPETPAYEAVNGDLSGSKTYQYGIDPNTLSQRITRPQSIEQGWGFFTKAVGEDEYSLQHVFLKSGRYCQVIQTLTQEVVLYLESGQVKVRYNDKDGNDSLADLKAQESILLPPGSSYSIGASADSYLYTFSGELSGQFDAKPYSVTATFDRRHKNWAETLIETIVNKEYTGKKIFFHKGNSSSLHFHCKKSELYFIHSGRLLLRLRAGQGEDRYFVLQPGETVKITPGLMHQAGALEDLTIIEVSTHDEDSDSYIVEGETVEMPGLREMIDNPGYAPAELNRLFRKELV